MPVVALWRWNACAVDARLCPALLENVKRFLECLEAAVFESHQEGGAAAPSRDGALNFPLSEVAVSPSGASSASAEAGALGK